MRLVLPALLLALLTAPATAAQDAETAALRCDLPAIPEGTGPVVDAFEDAFEDAFTCGWVHFLLDGIPCVLATPIDQPTDALLCSYPTIPLDQSAQARVALPEWTERLHSCLFLEDQPYTDTRFCTQTVPGLEHIHGVDEVLDELFLASWA